MAQTTFFRRNTMKKILLATLCTCLCWASLALAAVNINTATARELAALKGIGPAKAEAIVQYREKNGPFKSVNDLGKVKGLGAKTVEKLGKEITVSK
jgi:competence protein ComEA